MVEKLDTLNESGKEPHTVIKCVKEHVSAWTEIEDKSFKITTLSGLSNACYRVSVTDPKIKPESVLFRKFENVCVEKQLESLIFNTLSDQQIGPKNIFNNDVYRIEEFI